MAKLRYEWFLFGYKDGVPDVISKPFKTKVAAEKSAGKIPTENAGWHRCRHQPDSNHPSQTKTQTASILINAVTGEVVFSVQSSD
jgi:hypothetical protein